MHKTLFFIISFLLIFTPSQANAHVLITDDKIGAVVHINPNDDPIAGEESSFFFDFKDTSGKFKPENCDCQVTISLGGNKLFSQPFFMSSQSSLSMTINYTFPKKGIYILKITGQPKQPGRFNSFTLDYSIRVSKSTTPKKTNSVSTFISGHIIHLIGAFVIGLFVIIAFIKQTLKTKKNGGE